MAKPNLMLLFLPWCKVDKSYQIGRVELLPYNRGTAISGLDSSSQEYIDRAIGINKTITGDPVDNAALVRFDGRSLLSVLSEKELDITHELLAIACFAALSRRKYFKETGVVTGDYCNSDCFMLRVQESSDIKLEHTGFWIRHRAVTTKVVGYLPKDLSFTMPLHCHGINKVVLDERLESLSKQHADSCEHKWGRWQNALSCFNQANTDSGTIRPQMEWVLLCSAFEHLLGAESKAKDVARKFADVMQPAQEISAKDVARRSPHWQGGEHSLRFEWLREFYGIRGDFAHGRLVTRRPMVWKPLEHLVLATIAFPLVAKTLLQQEGRYKLTHEDKAQIDIFEEYADTEDFLNSSSGTRSAKGNHWERLFRKRKLDIDLSEGMEETARKLTKKFPHFFGDDP